VRVLDAAAVAAALPFDRLIAALRERFAAGCEVPPRHVHQIRGAHGETLTSLLMPAWTTSGQGGERYGVKIINIAPGNAARGLPGLHASYLLHDARSGVPLALLDGNELTARRTAAASALAASWLARADARHLLVVGAGRVASMVPLAYREVRPLDRVSVWARRSDAAQQLAQRLRAQGLAASAVGGLDAALAAADMVSCATLATTPLVHGRQLQPASHLDLIGSFTPQMREADDDALRGAAVYVDTPEALDKSGDLLDALASGALGRGEVRGTLEQLARGQVDARRSAHERTVFKSVGSALEDLAAAMLAVGPA
jgi:ornithine cyclodeaminase/alanine dehydrogenase-like protein (mu-crystallin family)